MILIADSGSTKTDWACTSENGVNVIRFKSLGYNPNYISGEEIRNDILANLPAGFPVKDVKEVYFYGAGVSELEYGFMQDVLKSVFVAAETVFVAMDLLGAARALLGQESGFAAILGTGCNTCLYNGEEVTLNIDSHGFILGDEGSGGYIGKTLLRDYMRGNMPTEVFAEVKPLVGKSVDEIIEQVYQKPEANRYCAQFCKWVGDHRHSHPYYHDLMLGAFRDFFRNIVSHYPDYRKYKFNCVGSVAFHYSDLLGQTAEEFGMKMGDIIKAPIDGLIEFHKPQAR